MVYHDEVREALAKMLRMEETTTTTNAVFIGHGYVQHAGEEWRGKYCLENHMYLILEEVELKIAIAFEYGSRLSTAPKTDG